HLNLLGQLVGLHQRQNLEQLVARPEAAGKDHERLGEVREPELAHEEIMELEVQTLGDVRVGPLLEGQTDVEADRLAARLARAPGARGCRCAPSRRTRPCPGSSAAGIGEAARGIRRECGWAGLRHSRESRDRDTRPAAAAYR